ncbi:DUF6093 family protein [Streptomyces sp. NPDC001642]|uniref:DUF6093 family protein n=1 Tax=Streptomyces sp. NPDC001642 TaxID=3154392 RepID=UPI00332376B8
MSVNAEGLTLGAVSELIQRKILTDTVRVSREGEPVFNPDTGQYEPGPPVIIYEGHGGIFPNGDPGIVPSGRAMTWTFIPCLRCFIE